MMLMLMVHVVVVVVLVKIFGIVALQHHDHR